MDLTAAAERLGVHYQTAYRWVRDGRLPAELIRGRYQLDPADVDRFERQRSRPAPRRARRPRGGFGPLAERMTEALVDGDERSARDLVGRLVADGVPLTTSVQELLVPALVQIGERWHAGELAIFVEHRASAIVQQILGEHHPTPRGRRRGAALVAAVSGDRHSLATAMAAAALREDNWRVHHLGADMPPEELASFCRTHDVDVAVITVTNPEVASVADALADRLRREGTPTLTGAAGRTLAELQELARDS